MAKLHAISPPASTSHEARHPNRRWLWFAIFVGPFSWSADFALSYGFTGRACTAQSVALLLIFSTLAIAATLTGLVTAVRANRNLPPANDDATGRDDPTRFMAVAGIAVSGGFLLPLVAAALPRLMVHPCV